MVVVIIPGFNGGKAGGSWFYVIKEKKRQVALEGEITKLRHGIGGYHA